MIPGQRTRSRKSLHATVKTGTGKPKKKKKKGGVATLFISEQTENKEELS